MKITAVADARYEDERDASLPGAFGDVAEGAAPAQSPQRQARGHDRHDGALEREIRAARSPSSSCGESRDRLEELATQAMLAGATTATRRGARDRQRTRGVVRDRRGPARRRAAARAPAPLEPPGRRASRARTRRRARSMTVLTSSLKIPRCAKPRGKSLVPRASRGTALNLERSPGRSSRRLADVGRQHAADARLRRRTHARRCQAAREGRRCARWGFASRAPRSPRSIHTWSGSRTEDGTSVRPSVAATLWTARSIPTVERVR